MQQFEKKNSFFKKILKKILKNLMLKNENDKYFFLKRKPLQKELYKNKFEICNLIFHCLLIFKHNVDINNYILIS